MTAPATIKAAAGQGLHAVVRHPLFWVAAIVLVLVLAQASRKSLAAWWAKQKKGPPTGNTDQLPGVPPLTVDTPFGQVENSDNPRIIQLRELAANLNVAIEGVPGWNDQRPELFMITTALHDVEIIYVAGYYATISSGNSLLQDVQDEWWVIPASARTNLIAKLQSLNL